MSDANQAREDYADYYYDAVCEILNGVGTPGFSRGRATAMFWYIEDQLSKSVDNGKQKHPEWDMFYPYWIPLTDVYEEFGIDDENLCDMAKVWTRCEVHQAIDDLAKAGLVTVEHGESNKSLFIRLTRIPLPACAKGNEAATGA